MIWCGLSITNKPWLACPDMQLIAWIFKIFFSLLGLVFVLGTLCILLLALISGALWSLVRGRKTRSGRGLAALSKNGSQQSTLWRLAHKLSKYARGGRR